MHDMGWAEFLHGPEASWRDLDEVLMSAANQGALRLRVHAAVPLSTWSAPPITHFPLHLRHPSPAPCAYPQLPIPLYPLLVCHSV